MTTTLRVVMRPLCRTPTFSAAGETPHTLRLLSSTAATLRRFSTKMSKTELLYLACVTTSCR